MTKRIGRWLLPCIFGQSLRPGAKILPVIAVVAVHVALIAPAWAADVDSGPYAVIEVGSKGVRSFLFDLDATRYEKCQADAAAYLQCLDLKQHDAINVNPLRGDAISATADAVATHAAELKQHHRVLDTRIYIVGSSGIANVEHRDRLVVAIEDRVQPAYAMDFVAADDEAKYGFNGVLGLFPAQYREELRRHALVIDIGSGNTKGAYLDVSGDGERLAGFSVPWGTVSATNQIDANRGSGAFLPAAVDWRDNAFLPELRSALDGSPGARDRDFILLIGGMPWALVTLTQPDAAQNTIPSVDVDNIEGLLRDASAPDAEARLCSANPHNTPGSDVARVCTVFSTNNLVAGAHILTAFAQELAFGSDKKQVYFFRASQFAWPLDYLRSRLSGDGARP